ncbi:MAG: outer membrane protein assembly factor BamD [Gemmatimonadota bacterium]
MRLCRAGLLMLLMLLLAGCSARGPNFAEMEPDDLYAQGEAVFEEGDWAETITILEFFVTRHLGDPRVPDARMMLGYAHMERGEYATAASHFQRLAADYPSHERALEARFQICEAYDELSPLPALDQEYTVSALINCQSVAENYPGTDEAEQAAAYVADLQYKLAQKVYQSGVFYFRRGALDSAVVYFEQVLQQYPNTSVAPAALAQLVETYDRLGYVEDAEEARQRLLQEYPQSPEAQALRA